MKRPDRIPALDPTVPGIFDRIIRVAESLRRKQGGRLDAVRADRRETFIRRMRKRDDADAK